VTIGSGVTTIGSSAFYGCTSLTSAVFQGNAPTMGVTVFASAANGFTVHYSIGATGFTSPYWLDSSGDTYPSAVIAKPNITSANTASGTYGTVFGGYAIVASGPPISFNATGLSATGLSINISTGLISGTPTKAGTFNVGLSATNSAGTGTATLTLTINKAALSVAVNSGGQSTYGNAPINPSIVVTNGTLYNGDSLANIGLSDDFSLTSASSANTYTINVTGGASVANYTVTTQSATFTINRAIQTITFPALTVLPYPSSPITLNETASSGLALSFSLVSGPATLSGTNNGTVNLTGTGTVVIQASQAGNANYLPAINVNQSLRVSAPVAFIGNTTATPENDGIANLLKYTFDIDPSSPMSATDYTALPTLGMTTTGGTEYLTLTYRQYALATGITVNVQTSPDLRTWTTQSSTVFSQVSTDPNTGDPIMEAEVPFSGTTEFMRLNVTSP